LQSYLITPVKRTPLPSSPPVRQTRDVEPKVEEVDTTKVTPNNYSKLKGIIYPGMDLFDAATPDEARRRNQKKDVSIVKNLENRSKLVQPTETVYGGDWDMKKQRHIDELEDNSSLIEGETPITNPKAKPRSRKRAPRLVKTKVKVRTRSPRRAIPGQHVIPAIVRIPSSTALNLNMHTSYSPTAEENAEFQYAVRNMPHRKRPGNFAIYTEGGPTAFTPGLSAYPGQHMAMNSAYTSQRLFPPPNPGWIQPQNQAQNPLCMSTNAGHRPMQPNYFDYLDIGKENIPPMENMAGNPLSWRSAVPEGSAGSSTSESSLGSQHGYSGYFTNPSDLADPFGYQRNPLADAVEHFTSTQAASTATDGSGEGDITSDDNTQDDSVGDAVSE
jgi:hypothetical protein